MSELKRRRWNETYRVAVFDSEVVVFDVKVEIRKDKLPCHGVRAHRKWDINTI